MESRVIVSCCNLNQWAMDFDHNLKNVITSIQEAKKLKARYRVGPELELSGYSCEDHFLELDTYMHCEQSLAAILEDPELTNDILCDIGCPFLHNNVRYNCRVYILNRKILLIRPKIYDSNNIGNNKYFSSYDGVENNEKLHNENNNYNNINYNKYHKKQNSQQTVTVAGVTVAHGNKNMADGASALQTHILSEVLRSVTNQISVPFGIAILQTDDTTLAVDMTEEQRTLYLSKVEIVSNSFNSATHEMRKLNDRIDGLKSWSHLFGGAYLYSNHIGCDGNGHFYFDGSSCILINGEVVAQASQFSLENVETAVAQIDMSAIRSYRVSIISNEVSNNNSLPVIPIKNFSLSSQIKKSLYRRDSSAMTIKTFIPEKECVLGPAHWLWDYLRRSGMAGFLLPLSGGMDSSSVAAILRVMCLIVAEAAVNGNEQVIRDILRICFNNNDSCELLNDIVKKYSLNVLTSRAYPIDEVVDVEDEVESKTSRSTSQIASVSVRLADQIAKQIVFTLQIGDETDNDKALVDELSQAIRSTHHRLEIDKMTALMKDSFRSLTGKSPKPFSHGGSQTEEYALLKMQGQLRKLASHFCASLFLWSQGRSGELVVLDYANIDKNLIRQYTYPSSDINPIGGMTFSDLKRMMIFVSKSFNCPILQRIVDMNQIKTDLDDTMDSTVITHNEISIIGYLRRVLKCGPVQTFLKLVEFWKPMSPPIIRDKVYRYYNFYALNRKTMTASSISYNYKNIDLRQVLYNPIWQRQYDTMSSIIKSNNKILDKIMNDPVKKNILLIIDPQNDFHPQGGTPGTKLYHPEGSLAVSGANEDSERIAEFIFKNYKNIHEIYVSMDSHHPSHIAHGMFWSNSKGEQPSPFTLISNEDICNGIWLPRDKKIRNS